MQIVKSQNKSVAEIVALACQVLARGGLVIYPTETVYGVGVDATSEKAVAKLLRYKSRREGKPLSIAVSDIEMASKYAHLNEQAKILYQQFMPGPVTIVSKDRGLLAPGVASEFATIGTRIPDYALVTDIVGAFGKPITATSANTSGKKRPYSIADVLTNLSEKQLSLIDLVIDAGLLPKNDPSTVIDTTLSTPVTLRRGELTTKRLLPDENDSYQLHSKSESETMGIAGRVLLKNWNRVNKTGIVIGLDGVLGVGKTVFTKGVAKFLGIKDKITSPTYTYVEEYDFTRYQTKGKLFHLDVWKVETEEEFERLEVKNLLKKNNIIIIEWFNQIKDWLVPMLASKNIPLVEVVMGEAQSKNTDFSDSSLVHRSGGTGGGTKTSSTPSKLAGSTEREILIKQK